MHDGWMPPQLLARFQDLRPQRYYLGYEAFELGRPRIEFGGFAWDEGARGCEGHVAGESEHGHRGDWTGGGFACVPYGLDEKVFSSPSLLVPRSCANSPTHQHASGLGEDPFLSCHDDGRGGPVRADRDSCKRPARQI